MERIETIIFKRRMNSNWEPGLIFDNDKTIIDKNSKSVDEVHDLKRTGTLSIDVSGISRTDQHWCDLMNADTRE